MERKDRTLLKSSRSEPRGSGGCAPRVDKIYARFARVKKIGCVRLEEVE